MKELDYLFPLLQENPSQHFKSSDFYQFLDLACQRIIAESNFRLTSSATEEFGEFGQLTLPYYSMGAIDSLKLFGLDELIIFSFYLCNKQRYKNVADMGANIGLHSVLMSKMGWSVTAFEPDPVHVGKIKENLHLNKCAAIAIEEAAVSDRNEMLTFTRLKNNNTGSHLKGMKQDVYGEIDEFTVNCLPFSTLIQKFDFIKMDIEGAEAKAVCSTNYDCWTGTDVMLEISTEGNAKEIWEHLSLLSIPSYSQKTGWQMTSKLEDLPTTYKEGSLFISTRQSPFPVVKEQI